MRKIEIAKRRDGVGKTTTAAVNVSANIQMKIKEYMKKGGV